MVDDRSPWGTVTESRAWVFIVVAGLLEVTWALGLKFSQGFSRPGPSAITIAALAGSMWLLAQAFRVLPAGSAYAVWVGIGAVGTAILGVVLLGESRSLMRLFCIALIVAGIIGVRVTK